MADGVLNRVEFHEICERSEGTGLHDIVVC